MRICETCDEWNECSQICSDVEDLLRAEGPSKSVAARSYPTDTLDLRQGRNQTSQKMVEVLEGVEGECEFCRSTLSSTYFFNELTESIWLSNISTRLV